MQNKAVQLKEKLEERKDARQRCERKQKINYPRRGEREAFYMKKLMKKVAAVGLAGAMMVGGAMTSLAADTYFYVYENGVFGAARMGQDCVASVSKRGNNVTMNLQDSNYGSYVGRITDAFVDANKNGVHDEGETTLLSGTKITYNQSNLATTVNEVSYANFSIVVTILDSGDEPVYTHNPQSVYVPMQ